MDLGGLWVFNPAKKTSPAKNRKLTFEDEEPTQAPEKRSVFDDLIDMQVEDAEDKKEISLDRAGVTKLAKQQKSDYLKNIKKVVGKNKKIYKSYLRNPFLYHQQYGVLHPHLSNVAIRYLSRPASSAENERSFAHITVSTFGRRNRTGLEGNINIRQQLQSYYRYKSLS